MDRLQIAAASTALILGEGRRKNGRWEYGLLRNGRSSESDEGALKALRQCGLVLDVLGRDGLRRVRDRHDTLDRVAQICATRFLVASAL